MLNLKNCEFDNVLKNSSVKLMERTVAYYKRMLKDFESNSHDIASSILFDYPERRLYISTLFQRKSETLNIILERQRLRKFKRDKLDLTKAKEHSLFLMNKYEIIKLTTPPVNVVISSESNDRSSNQHHPIILNTGQTEISDDLKNLCAKGPSFIPTPINYDWLQLQKDFDSFKNRIRARFMFNNSSSNTTQNSQQQSNESLPAPPRKKSTWRAPSTTSPEIETFLSRIESALFADTSRKSVKDNLKIGERESLKSWRKEQLFNKTGDLVMRSQDKGNRFVVVNKETDIQKANDQINRSSFKKLDHDPTKDHIEIVKPWSNK